MYWFISRETHSPEEMYVCLLLVRRISRDFWDFTKGKNTSTRINEDFVRIFFVLRQKQEYRGCERYKSENQRNKNKRIRD